MVGELHLVVALWDRAEVGGKADRDIVRVHLGHLDHNMITCIHNMITWIQHYIVIIINSSIATTTPITLIILTSS